MNLQLQDKTALVTGSTTGIGFAIAQLLAEEGATVAINGRSEARVSAAIEKIKSAHPKAKLLGVAADVATEKGADAIYNKLKKVDILINNVGIYEMKSFYDISDDEWLNIFNVNVMSGVRLSRHYLPAMLEQNWGRIIFISSESGLQIPKEMIHYGMTKTAQIAIARGLAEMTTMTNVTVNSVLPGPTHSEGVEQIIEKIAAQQNASVEALEKQFFETIRPSSLLKRFISPNEIAVLVAYLASPVSGATNGAALLADGGVVRAIA